MPIPLGILAVAGAGAGGASSFDLLETTVISGSSTSTVTFTGLGSYSDYKHLQIRYTAKTTSGNSNSELYLRFNGISTSSYARRRLQGDGSSVTSGAQTSQAEIYNGFLAAGSFNTTDVWAAGIIDILDFSSSNKNTTLRSLNGGHLNADSRFIRLTSGGFFNTAAITSISITADFGPNFVTGSRFSLYGIK